MQPYSFVGIVTLTALGTLAADKPAEPTLLFNGKDLTSWVVEGSKEYKDGTTTKPIWVAEEGMIRNQVKGGSYGWLRYSKQEFSDFALHVEYRFAAPANPKAERGNSGIGIRTIPFDPKNFDTRASVAAYEVQLLDDSDRPADKHSTGSLYNYVAPTAVAAKPAPEWNSIDIECKGPHIQITINGKKVLDVDQSTNPAIKDKPLKGYISLQNHSGRIDFRNIHIRDLSR